MNRGDPRGETRRRAEERVAEIWRELAVGETCSGDAEAWKVVEEGLLDELTDLELSLLRQGTGSHDQGRPYAGPRPERRRY